MTINNRYPADAHFIPPDAERVFEGIIYDVYHWQQPMYDGTVSTFEMLKRPDTVTVIPVVDGRLLTLEQRQPNWPAPRLTFPGGRVNSGEDWLTGVKRETLEESGYEFDDWRLVHV